MFVSMSFRLDKCDKQTNTNVNVDGTMHKGPTSHSTLFLLCEQEYFSKTFSLFFFLYTRKKKFRSMALLRSRHSAHPITLALDKLHRIIRSDSWYVCVYVGLCPCMCVYLCVYFRWKRTCYINRTHHLRTIEMEKKKKNGKKWLWHCEYVCCCLLNEYKRKKRKKNFTNLANIWISKPTPSFLFFSLQLPLSLSLSLLVALSFFSVLILQRIP